MANSIGNMPPLELKEMLDKIKNKAQGHEALLDNLNEHYSCGHCMDLAIALHRRFGFEIQAAITTEPNSDDWIGHAWVAMTDGKLLDIMGTYTNSIELDSFGDKTVSGLDEKGLRKYIKNDADLTEDIKKAMVVVAAYLQPEFKLKEPERDNELGF